jgi:hypothetical protein
MSDAFRTILPVAVLLVAAHLVAATAEQLPLSSAAPLPATPVAPTQFARIAKDTDGSPRALQLAIVSYAPESGARDFSVDLIGAIHVGDKEYYQGLNDRFHAYDALLYELIVPDDTHAPQKPMRSTNFIGSTQIGIKNALGLAFQLDEIDYGPANFVHADLSYEMLAQSMADRGESLYVYFWRLVFASIDDYARDPLGLRNWRLLSSMLSSPRGDALKIAVAHEMVNAMKTGDILGSENGSAVIAARNEHAVRILKDRIDADAKRIGIFYGVAHMADFEQRLLNELAVAKTETEWVDAWRFTDGQVMSGQDVDMANPQMMND